MALANDSITVTPGTGATVATNSVGGKEHQVVQIADAEGHIEGSPLAYIAYFSPRVLTAAATDQFDIFNATGSGVTLRLRGLYPVITRTVATAFIIPWQFDIVRTNTIGTGGTAFTKDSATTPAAGAGNFVRFSNGDAALGANVTARALPTGGAAIANFLFSMFVLPEETFPYETLAQGINWMPELPHEQPWEIRENEGFKVRQITATASTGASIGWIVSFTTV